MLNSISGYGLDYEKRISKKQAIALCGMYPLPRMGYETHVAIKPDPIYSGFWFRLTVQNVSGVFVLACTNVKNTEWPTVFGVKL